MTRVEQVVVRPQLHIHGQVSKSAREYTAGKLEAALRQAPGRVLRTSLTLDAAAPGNHVHAYVDVNGAGVHVHAAGDTMYEAVDLLQERLRSRLRRLRRTHRQGPEAHPAETGDAAFPLLESTR